MSFTALEFVGFLIIAFVSGLVLAALLAARRWAVSSSVSEIAQAQLDEADQDRTAFSNERLKLSADLDARTRQVSELESQLAGLAATHQEADRVCDLEASFEEPSRANRDVAAAPNTSAGQRVAELEAEVGRLQSRLNRAAVVEGRLVHLEVEAGRVAGLEAQLDVLRAESDAHVEVESSVEETGEALRELERELEAARGESAGELGALEQMVADLQADAERVPQIEAELEGVRAVAAAREEQLEARLIEADLDAQRMAFELERSHAVVATAEARLATLETQIAHAQDRAAELEGQIALSESRAIELAAQVAEALAAD